MTATRKRTLRQVSLTVGLFLVAVAYLWLCPLFPTDSYSTAQAVEEISTPDQALFKP